MSPCSVLSYMNNFYLENGSADNILKKKKKEIILKVFIFRENVSSFGASSH